MSTVSPISNESKCWDILPPSGNFGWIPALYTCNEYVSTLVIAAVIGASLSEAHTGCVENTTVRHTVMAPGGPHLTCVILNVLNM